MFKCSMCGKCCRELKGIELYKELDRGDGICKYLENNKCSIYEKRPLLCRVDESYEKYFSEIYTLDEYYKLNYKVCESLKKEEN